jgi:DNA-binding transcriptional LysR family regulator
MSIIHFETLDLNLLRVLNAILEEGSVTRAGERLGITQSAVSHALSRLRVLLDDPLLVRSPSGMAPTARGAEIAAALPGALAHLHTALVAPVFEPRISQRVFTVIAGPYACAVVQPALIARILREAPGVRVQIRSYSEDMLERLHRGETDLLVARHGVGAPHFHDEKLFDETLVWVVRARHPLANGPVNMAALTSVPHVVIDNPQSVFDQHDPLRMGGVDQGAFQRELEKRGMTQQIGLVVPDTQSALAVVSQTDMAALVPRRIAAMRPPAGPLKIIRPPYASPRLALGFLARRDKLAASDLAWFVDHLRAVAASLAG